CAAGMFDIVNSKSRAGRVLGSIPFRSRRRAPPQRKGELRGTRRLFLRDACYFPVLYRRTAPWTRDPFAPCAGRRNVLAKRTRAAETNNAAARRVVGFGSAGSFGQNQQ